MAMVATYIWSASAGFSAVSGFHGVGFVVSVVFKQRAAVPTPWDFAIWSIMVRFQEFGFGASINPLAFSFRV